MLSNCKLYTLQINIGFLKTMAFTNIREFLESGCIVPPPQIASTLKRPNETPVAGSSAIAHSWVLGWGGFERSARPQSEGCSLYVPDFFLEDPQPWVRFQFNQTLTHAHLVSALETFLIHFHQDLNLNIDLDLNHQAPYFSWETPRRDFFESGFLEIQQQILHGDLKKAVPVVFLRSKKTLDPKKLLVQRAYLLLQLLKNTQGSPLYLYGWWDSEGNGILGATPELLFTQTHASLIQTMALAGTRIQTENSPQALPQSALPALLDDPKERLEHQIVVDSIYSSLSSLGQVVIGQTQELRLQTLVHLYTPISLSLESTLQDSDFSSWVKALHPTPALGAYPRDKGWLWLKTQESRFKRYRFGAPFGVYFNSQSSYCLVAIRNLQWISGQLLMGAGCGIVYSSDLEREWREIQGKLQAIHRSFGFDLRNEAQFV